MTEPSGLPGMNRRSFVGALGAAGLGVLGVTACAPAATAATGRRQLDRIGLQLYTVRSLMQQNVAETLQSVANAGYQEVETAGLFGLTPAQFRAELDRAGLVSPAAHVSIGALRDNLPEAFSAAHTLGQRWVVVPSLPQAERTLAGYQRVAADLNRFGAAAQQQELRVGYHNHAFEFEPLPEGRNGYDVLLAETDPALVDMELDLYWAVHAGHEPVELFRQHPGRFSLCHVKDMVDIGGEQRLADVGQGEMDFARIFAHGEQAGLRHYFVEHDNPADPLASIQRSHQYLRQLRF
jgi:sugar phosphate isomerase/epimerase